MGIIKRDHRIWRLTVFLLSLSMSVVSLAAFFSLLWRSGVSWSECLAMAALLYTARDQFEIAANIFFDSANQDTYEHKHQSRNS